MNKQLILIAIVLTFTICLADDKNQKKSKLTDAQIDSIKKKYEELKAQNLTLNQIQLAFIEFASTNKIDNEELQKILQKLSDSAKQANQKPDNQQQKKDQPPTDQKSKPDDKQKKDNQKSEQKNDKKDKNKSQNSSSSSSSSTSSSSSGSGSASGSGLTSSTGAKPASP